MLQSLARLLKTEPIVKTLVGWARHVDLLTAHALTYPVLSPADGIQEAGDHREPGCHILKLASNIAEDAALILQIP